MRKEIERIALVDVAHIWHTTWHATADLPMSEAFERTVSKVRTIGDGDYDRVVCGIDAPPYKRNTLFPAYKAGREKKDPSFYEQYERVQERLKGLGFLVWKADGYEADDVIATAVRHAKALNIACDIYTNDKDLLQLVDDGKDIVVVSTRNGARLDEEAVYQNLGVCPFQVVDFLALWGDKADNIPGCPNCGPKTAAAMLDANELEDILLIADEGNQPVGGGKAVTNNLREHADQIIQGKTLIQLFTEVPIVWDEIYDEAEMGEIADEMIQHQIDRQPRGGTDVEREAIQSEPRIVDEVARELLADRTLTPEGTKAPYVNEEGDLVVNEREREPRPVKMANLVAMPKMEVIPPVQSLVDAIELRPGVYLTQEKAALLWKLAQRYDGGGLYRRLGNAEAIFTIMLLGTELDISPLIACQNFHNIQGKPTAAAHFLIALAKRDKDCRYLECIEEKPDHVTYETKKRSHDKTLTFTYSIKDAEDDGAKWVRDTKNRRAMLRKTAGCHAARLFYPEACSGLHSTEEMGVNVEEESA